MNKKFTPGPWSGREGISAADGKLVCSLHGVGIDESEGSETRGRSREEWNANSRLIAAAPEMLELLKRLLDKLPCADETLMLNGVTSRLIDRIEGKL